MKQQIEITLENNNKLPGAILNQQLEALEQAGGQGIIDFSDEVYHNGIGVSNSQLSDFAVTPKKFHYNHIMGNKDMSSEAMDIGDLVHKAILEPHLVHETYVSDAELLEKVYALKPDSKSPRATKHYKELILEYEVLGKKVLKDEHFDMMRKMVDAVYSHPRAKNMLSNGMAEKCLYATDPETGLVLRGKADFILIDGIIIDVKTTASANPDEFSKSIWNYRYHVQAAFYLHLARLAIGEQFKDFVWICLEKTKPFDDMAIYTPDEGTLDFGQQMFRKNLNELAKCYQTNKWPGYSNNIEQIALPNWAWNKAEGLI